ncbi:MAG: hypothetical protein ACTHK3_09420, partial [Solirubrobacterales bacterium]
AALAGERVGILGAAGLSIHSFIDGLGIGFADGLNTVSYVLRRSGNRQAAIRWLTIDALAPLLGAVVGSLAAIPDHTLGYVLCIYCGIFLYIGAADLLPEAPRSGLVETGGIDRRGVRLDLCCHPGRWNLIFQRFPGNSAPFGELNCSGLIRLNGLYVLSVTNTCVSTQAEKPRFSATPRRANNDGPSTRID